MVWSLGMLSIKGFLAYKSKLQMTYKHLSRAERYQNNALIKVVHYQSQSANMLHWHKPTISPELNRNKGSRGYRPKQGYVMYADRQQNRCNANTVRAWGLLLLSNKTCTLGSSAFADKLKPMAARVKMLTFDNGRLFAVHANID
jgi:IS30 family transposase